MDLWIRSQKKDVLLPVELEIQATGSEKNGYVMYGLQKYNASAITLGEYKTKERALEVLDEIQIRIINNEILKTMIPKLNKVKGEEEKIGKLFKEMVYEMPQE